MTDVTQLFTPGWYDNDADNDCTAAALVNCARAASLLQNGTDLATDDGAVLRWFLAATNWRGAPSADPGADPNMILNYAMLNGIDVGQQVPLVIRQYTRLGVADRAAIAAGVNDTGSAYVTLRLGVGDWGLQKDCEHQVMFGRVDGLGDGDNVWIGTWGKWSFSTWVWLASRMLLVWRLLFALPAPHTAQK